MTALELPATLEMQVLMFCSTFCKNARIIQFPLLWTTYKDLIERLLLAVCFHHHLVLCDLRKCLCGGRFVCGFERIWGFERDLKERHSNARLTHNWSFIRTLIVCDEWFAFRESTKSRFKCHKFIHKRETYWVWLNNGQQNGLLAAPGEKKKQEYTVILIYLVSSMLWKS